MSHLHQFDPYNGHYVPKFVKWSLAATSAIELNQRKITNGRYETSYAQSLHNSFITVSRVPSHRPTVRPFQVQTPRRKTYHSIIDQGGAVGYPRNAPLIVRWVDIFLVNRHPFRAQGCSEAQLTTVFLTTRLEDVEDNEEYAKSCTAIELVWFYEGWYLAKKNSGQ